MPGYDRDGYEDLDEYEEEGEEQEEEEVEEDELEEEEAHQPTQEELEYLELRQRLKEVIRKQMKKDTGSARTSAREEKNKLPYDNYGSFFGPSQPVIAQRVIQESKSLLENPRLAAKVSNSNKSNTKGFASTPAGSKPRANDHPPKVTSGLKSKSKVQMLKNTRDYSFLLSDDAELPAPTKDPPHRNLSVPNSEAQSAQVPSKSKQLSTNSGRIVPNGRDGRKSVPTGGSQMQPKVGPHKLASVSKPNMTSVDSRKQLGSNNGNGPGRPPGSKGLPSKIPVAAIEKKVTAPGVKSPMPGVRKPLPSKLQSSIRKQPLVHKKEFQESSRGKMSKQLVSSSKPQIKQPPAKISARATLQENRSKKRPVRQYSDDDEGDDGGRAISMIRNMFRYNPNKYCDDDDDSDMEANFDDILKEERRSAKIAREEDEEELRKIEEEERRERLRKAAKKRKLSP